LLSVSPKATQPSHRACISSGGYKFCEEGCVAWGYRDGMQMKRVRKRSRYHGRKYRRYRRGYWSKYKRKRRFAYIRVISNIKRIMDDLPDPYRVKPPGTRGRPPVPPKVILIAILIKELFGLSYISTESFLLWIVQSNPYILPRVPAANTIQEHVKDIPISYMQKMLFQTLKILENQQMDIIIDATGICTRQYGRWRTSRYASKKIKRKYIKIHIIMDPERNIVLIGASTKGWKGDHPIGLKLMKHLEKVFNRHGIKVRYGLGDSGYRSRKMATQIEKMGGKPMIKIKKGDTAKKKGSKAWSEMVRFQREEEKEFQKIYCQRVIIEGFFSAFKSIFGTTITSRKRHNQNVQIMARLILWNCMHIEPVHF